MPNAHAWGTNLTSNFGKNTYRSLAMRTSRLVAKVFTRTRTLIIVSHRVPFSFSLWTLAHLWLGERKVLWLLMEKSLFVLRTLGIWSHNVQELWSKHLTWCKFHKYSGFFSNGRHRFLNWTFTNSGAYHLPEFQAYLMSLRTRIATMIRNPYLRLRILWP
ncbi:hypothetical protein VNO77_39280 [Canavalia gladiata]|uniref:Uncharacterized protein n=1 Tax=Canavalia gladiata TaxID=3824 RepID=A0AAN9KCD1_CANGL